MFVLTPFRGSGKIGIDPFRVRQFDQPGCGVIDLRPDGGRTLDGSGLNAALAWTPVRDHRDIALGADLADRLGAVQRRRLGHRFQMTLRARTVRDLLWELMMTPPAGGWNPLRASRRGDFALLLGPFFGYRAAISGGADHLETWSTGDSADLSSSLTWTPVSGTAWALVGNRARGTGNVGMNVERAEHDTTIVDQEVSVDVATFTYSSAILAGALCARFASAANTYYMHQFARTGAGSFFDDCSKILASVETQLVSNPTAGGPTAVARQLRIVGSLLTAFVAGTFRIGVTDTAIDGSTVGGRRGGIRCYTNAAGNMIEMDNWRLRDYSGPWSAVPTYVAGLG